MMLNRNGSSLTPETLTTTLDDDLELHGEEAIQFPASCQASPPAPGDRP
jgi:hypothetical protein